MPASSGTALLGGVRAWLPSFVAGLLFSALTAAAFPPVGLWGFVFLAPMPLIWAGVRGGRAGSDRLRDRVGLPVSVALGALPLWAYEQVWVSQVSGAGYVPMILILAGFAGLLAWLIAGARRWMPALPLSLTVPVAWTGVEFLRGDFFFGGFPWLLLAHPTIDAPLLPTTAALLGTYFTSFLIAALCGAAADVMFQRPRRIRPALFGVAGVGACVLAAQLTRPAPAPGGGEFRIAVVQTNIPQDNKMEWAVEQRIRDFARFVELTRQAAAASPPPDLIVWPETMFPGEVLDPPSVEAQRRARLAESYRDERGEEQELRVGDFADALVQFQRDLGIPMLVGAMATTNLRFERGPEGKGYFPVHDARYNSVFLVEAGEVRPERYDKIELTPFGEEMPYISHWPWLERQLLAVGARGMAFDLDRGTGPTAFEIRRADGGSARVVTPICFEATRAAHCRRLVNGGRADLMINLTNDGWFGWFDPARWQHLQIARWRCVELGVPMVRAANTGISAHIDARGRIVRIGVEGGGPPTRTDGVLVTSVSPGRGATIFATVGGVFGWSAFAGAVLLAAGSLRGWARSGRGQRADGGAGASH